MLRGIDRLVLRVPSLPAAVTYYRDVLGLHVARQEQRVASLRFAGASRGIGDGEGGAAAEIILHSDPDLPAEALYFLVEDVRAMYRRRAELKLTFTSPPTRIARGYRATVKDPFGTVLHLLDRAAEAPPTRGSRATAGAGSAHVEDAKAAGALFAGMSHKVPAKADLLVRLYTKLARTADDLPYTPHFESLFEPYAAAFDDPKPDRAEVWRHLLNLRKRAKLPKLGEARSPAPELPAESRAALRDLLGDDIGKRERLPYTPRFEQIVEQFNATLPRKMSPHLVWRLVATLAK